MKSYCSIESEKLIFIAQLPREYCRWVLQQAGLPEKRLDRLVEEICLRPLPMLWEGEVEEEEEVRVEGGGSNAGVDSGSKGPGNSSGNVGLVGPAGPAGPVGSVGPVGPAGRDGVDGKEGEAGSTGPVGPAG